MIRVRIAVVDDDASHVELLREVLEDEGYEVVVSVDLRDAVVLVKDQRPTLVILDLFQARQLIGLDVVHQLKADRETRDIPVVVISADTAALRTNAAELRMYGVVAMGKPYGLDELLSNIQGAVDGRARAAASALHVAEGASDRTGSPRHD